MVQQVFCDRLSVFDPDLRFESGLLHCDRASWDFAIEVYTILTRAVKFIFSVGLVVAFVSVGKRHDGD